MDVDRGLQIVANYYFVVALIYVSSLVDRWHLFWK